MPLFRREVGYSKEEIRDNAELLFGLKCISCKQYMHPPIRQCTQGHSSCNRCIAQNEEGRLECKVCGCDIISGRNIHLENIAKKAKFPCRNHGNGCNGMFTMARLDDHEDRCPYGQFKCFIKRDCEWTGQKQGLMDHVKISHPYEQVMSKYNLCTIKNFSQTRGEFVRLVRAYGELFWCHHFKDAQFAYWTMQFTGPDLRCPDYSYDFKISSAEVKGRCLVFKKMECATNTRESMLASEFGFGCIKISMDTIEKFKNEEGNVNVTIAINKHIIKISNKSKKT